jgi:hypothetical protein
MLEFVCQSEYTEYEIKENWQNYAGIRQARESIASAVLYRFKRFRFIVD